MKGEREVGEEGVGEEGRKGRRIEDGMHTSILISQLFVGFVLCLLSLGCSVVLGLFDKRAERITRRKEEGSGEHHVPVLNVAGEEEGEREGEGERRGREEKGKRKEEEYVSHISLISFSCSLVVV